MNNYLYLIYQLRINDKLRNVKSFLKFLQKVPDVYLISLFFIVSIFKLVCSVITIVVLDEILSLFSLSFTLPYVIVLLLYLFSMEDHQKNKTLLNKLLPFFCNCTTFSKQIRNKFIVIACFGGLDLEVRCYFAIYSFSTDIFEI